MIPSAVPWPCAYLPTQPHLRQHTRWTPAQSSSHLNCGDMALIKKTTSMTVSMEFSVEVIISLAHQWCPLWQRAAPPSPSRPCLRQYPHRKTEKRVNVPWNAVHNRWEFYFWCTSILYHDSHKISILYTTVCTLTVCANCFLVQFFYVSYPTYVY